MHKRLWDLTKEHKYLDESIAAYERGFYLKQDYYNGINLAFLLNVRASLAGSAGDERAEAVADAVLARRVRRQVVTCCDRALTAGTVSDSERYWIVATKWEAAVGLEDVARAADYRQEAERMPVAGWMLDSTRSQVARLEELIARSPLRGGALEQTGGS